MKKDNPPLPPPLEKSVRLETEGDRGDLKGISCYLSEIQDIPTEIEERMYRRDDGKNQTG